MDRKAEFAGHHGTFDRHLPFELLRTRIGVGTRLLDVVWRDQAVGNGNS